MHTSQSGKPAFMYDLYDFVQISSFTDNKKRYSH